MFFKRVQDTVDHSAGIPGEFRPYTIAALGRVSFGRWIYFICTSVSYIFETILLFEIKKLYVQTWMCLTCVRP